MLKETHDHLDSVRESYGEHMRFALWFALKLIGAGFAVIAHAVCPAIFQTTGSRTVNELHVCLQKRKDHQHHHE